MCNFTYFSFCSDAHSCVLFCDPMDCSPPGPLSMGFSRQEYQNGLTFPPPGDLPNPGIKSMSPELAGRFLTTEIPGKPHFPFYFILFVITMKIFLLFKFFLET